MSCAPGFGVFSFGADCALKHFLSCLKTKNSGSLCLLRGLLNAVDDAVHLLASLLEKAEAQSCIEAAKFSPSGACAEPSQIPVGQIPIHLVIEER